MAPNNKKYKSSSRQKSMNKIFYAIALIVIVIVAAGVAYVVIGNSAAKKPIDEYSATSTKVLLHTSAGDITIELRDDKPITATNFVNIVKSGAYNGTTFYRTMTNFMIQGGQIAHPFQQ